MNIYFIKLRPYSQDSVFSRKPHPWVFIKGKPWYFYQGHTTSVCPTKIIWAPHICFGALVCVRLGRHSPFSELLVSPLCKKNYLFFQENSKLSALLPPYELLYHLATHRSQTISLHMVLYMPAKILLQNDYYYFSWLTNKLLHLLATCDILGYLFTDLKFHEFHYHDLWISYGLLIIIDPWIPILSISTGARLVGSLIYWGSIFKASTSIITCYCLLVRIFLFDPLELYRLIWYSLNFQISLIHQISWNFIIWSYHLYEAYIEPSYH